MPKLIDYPRTSYPGAWEIAEVVDDTGGKCALDTCARKLNRKVSGSFKAIVGSAVKFGLLTSKREMLATTTLFRRIKHAYDKQEELVFHREAFLTPPLFTQLCRKFRARELPVAMLDVLLIREFGVEEINAQGVAKAFIDGARMVNLLDEHDVVADIDQLAAQQPPRRELASPTPSGNAFRQLPPPHVAPAGEDDAAEFSEATAPPQLVAAGATTGRPGALAGNLPPTRLAPAATADAIATLFGFSEPGTGQEAASSAPREAPTGTPAPTHSPAPDRADPLPDATTAVGGKTGSAATGPTGASAANGGGSALFRIHLVGPGLNTQLDVVDADDLALVRALLDKIERQLRK